MTPLCSLVSHTVLSRVLPMQAALAAVGFLLPRGAFPIPLPVLVHMTLLFTAASNVLWPLIPALPAPEALPAACCNIWEARDASQTGEEQREEQPRVAKISPRVLPAKPVACPPSSRAGSSEPWFAVLCAASST